MGAAILIAGPTASGKSALAVGLAEAIGGIVVNADSMQVYRELRLLSARPEATDEARAPHALYGHVPAAEPYSVARWLDEVLAVLAAARAENRPAIVVGGTGLYFEALTCGLSPIPEIPDDVRVFWRAEAERVGAGGLHAMLEVRDPAMAARLEPADTQRLTRALEVLDGTGRSLRDWQAVVPEPPLAPGTYRTLVLAPDRGWLHGRIARRFAGMVEAGGVAEAVAFAALGLAPDQPATRAIGVAPLAAASRGEIDLREAIERAVIETRRYAKRQETWFRNRMAAWPRLDPRNIDEAPSRLAKEMQSPS
ncbi:tRNA (adenosine(37)-N6)-dimethylallyltransferase MiaA [Segnochrobactrum spirostomi]|uniref:tRNA dimethylallyltransferase n=1 Tax=Segnochrobactrum spirostomi TaxID=2608987 RepID=A0A6A7XYV2_9HYPH|nr:tRNA (adenosine(37)-N6)-dimethylallyltransferase MiaA [Segnochrobactrum spirostomi]MQT11297.1 tRNA (adenosine(37)-N6)-dimethylallyltransferase MiaA [Segnochrobactrum spirostomi]